MTTPSNDSGTSTARRLRWVLALQVLVFAVWGVWLLSSHRIADTVWLETDPVDPRDLLAGHYVALAYPLAESAERLCGKLLDDHEPGKIYLRLEERSEPVMTIDGPVHTSHAVECRGDPPPLQSGWIAGERTAGSRFRRVTFGIERFYVPESSPLRAVTSGEVLAKIAINDAHVPRIIGLVSRFEPIPPVPVAPPAP